MPKLSKFALIILTAAIALIGAGYWYYSQNTNSQTHKIVLGKNGFVPQEITIAKGGTVIFTTTRGKEFWPASDLHPTHKIYPEFDPKEPIEPGASWSFRFNEIGEWKYHDHLSPLFRGMIRVVEENTRGSAEISDVLGPDQADCDNSNYAIRAKCREDVIYSLLETKGIDAAYQAIAKFSQNDPQFSADCHGISHEIGEKAYVLFAKRENFQLSPKTSYCAYGFYHGFMEALLHDGKDASEARAFCAYARDTLGDKTTYAEGACYHGIGHGAVEDEPNPKSRGNAQAIIQPSLEICKKISNDEHHLFLCSSGVFNALEIISTGKKYGVSLNEKDPFWICRIQPEQYKRACYTQFLVAAMHVAQNDFLKTARVIDTIPEDAYAQETLAGASIERVHLGKTDYQETIFLCRSLSDRFLLPCITGFAEGFLKYGPPEKEYEGAVSFCNSRLLTEKERAACFERILSILRIWYPQEKSKEICMSVDKKYWWNKCNYQ
ncbi:MAG: Uncharacterized protein G01um101433_989 [Parcubacteria group bacterium Gr01-1014_33]|nr:MAG: Uncharacterized protein G01um101433_989 [Parcubacteria group bacterium Gr01-1014_33]